MEAKLKVVITDDEVMARTLLEGMLLEYCPNIEVVALCEDIPSAVKAIHKYTPDIVFMDIEMPGYSGLDILDFFSPEDVDFSIIFVTAYHQYAIDAFRLSAVDYLLKPLEPEMLIASIQRYESTKARFHFELLKHNVAPGSIKRLSISGLNSIRFVEVDSVMCLKAEGAYSEINLSDGSKITSSKNLKSYETMLLGCSEFFRCHKSYIVNLNYIQSVIRADGGSILLKNGNSIDIANDKIQELIQRMQ
jgi:two-component system, LytTR family, response regulator